MFSPEYHEYSLRHLPGMPAVAPGWLIGRPDRRKVCRKVADVEILLEFSTNKALFHVQPGNTRSV